MYLSESDIHFGRWIYPKNQKGLLLFFLVSAFFHAILLVACLFLSKQQEITSVSNDESAVHITLLPPKKTSEKQQETQKNQLTPNTKIENHKTLLTDENHKNKPSQITRQSQQNQALDRFLPHSRTDFFRGLRNEAQNSEDTQAQGGDIPIPGKSTSPIEQPRIQDRHSVRDLGLFQFSEEFRNRFGAIWNEQDRIVPPDSPLRPGDVVFYKVYINDDGTLNHYENTSAKRFSQKDFSHLDRIFSDVIQRVFPMVVPPQFSKKGKIITQMVAIQVVDRSLPMNFSF